MPQSLKPLGTDAPSKRGKTKRLGAVGLKSSKETLEALIQCSPLAVIALDAVGTVTVWNPAAQQIFGWSAEEVIGKPNPIVPPEKREEFHSTLKRTLKGEICSEVETFRRRKDGSDVEVRISASPTFHRAGGISGAMAVISDITEQRRSQEMLLESEARHRLLFEDNPLPMWLYDILSLSFLAVNDAAVLHYGYSRDEFLSMTIKDIRPAEDRDALMEAVSGINGKLRKPGVWRHRKKNGQLIDVDIITHDIDFRGRRARLVLATDVTERRQAEEHLRVSLRFLEIVHAHREIAPLLEAFVAEIKEYTGCDAVGIRMLDEEGNIPYVAYKGFSRKFYASESPLSIKTDFCMCINVISGNVDSIKPFYTKGGSFYINGTTRFLAAVSKEDKGKTRNMCNMEGYESVALVPFREGNRILGLIHVADRRENMVPLKTVEMLEKAAMQLGTAFQRVRAEDKLRASEDRYRSLFENMLEGVAYCRMLFEDNRPQDFIYLHVNTAFEKLTGLKDVAGKKVTEVIPGIRETHPELFETYGRVSLTGVTEKFEIYLEPLGAWLAVSVYSREKNFFVAVFDNITERKQAEEALRRAEKKFRELFDSTLDGIYQVDADGMFTMLNRAGAKIFGYDDPGQIIGRPVLDYWRDPKDRETFLSELKEKKTVSSSRLSARKKDGDPIVLEVSSRIIENDEGELMGTEGILRDVTEHVRADEHMRRLLERATALYEGSYELTGSLDVQDLAGNVSRTCVERFGVSMAWIGRAEDDGSVSCVGHFPPESSYPRRITVRWDDSPFGRGSTGRAIRGGRPVSVDDVLKDPDLSPWHDEMRKENISSIAAFPLISRGRTYGVLKLYSGEAGFFTEEYIQFFQTYAHHVAAVLETARLFEETQQHLDHLRALRAIDMAITSSLDLRVTLDVLLDNVTSQLKVDAAAVLLLNPHSKLLEYAAGRGFHTRALQHTRLKFGEGHAGQAVAERRIVRVLNVAASEGFARVPMLKAEGFVSYFGVPLIAKGHVNGVLEIFNRKQLNPGEQWFEFLDALAGQAAIAIDNAFLFNDLERSNTELTMAYETTLDGWSRALDLRDKETEGHTQRVAEMTLRLAEAMGLGDEDLIHVRRGALLHDIGKMGVPDNILLKPGKLTDEEWEIMRRHPIYAYELLSPIAYLRNAIDIPYCHHEKWDGTGYPRGLKREQIPLAARIFAVMDVWDALRSDRPYRPAWPEEKTREHIRALSGTHFDPKVVEIFLKIRW